MTGTLIGHRADGRPIHLLWGGADDDGTDTPPQPPPPPPAAPTPKPADDAAALRVELEQARAEAAQNAERLRALMAGGSAPQQGSDGGDGGDDEDDDAQSGPKPADPEMAKLQRALRAANRESKARREQADKLRSEWEAQDNARKEQLAEAQRLSEAAEKARQEAEARYRPATIKLAALPAFLAAGAKSERVDRLVRLLDLTALDVDGNGEVTGLADQVAAVKADYPELFASAEPPKPPVARVSAADRPPAEQAPTRSADILARGVLGHTA